MFAPMRPTPTKPILEDFIRTKISHPQMIEEEALALRSKTNGCRFIHSEWRARPARVLGWRAGRRQGSYPVPSVQAAGPRHGGTP